MKVQKKSKEIQSGIETAYRFGDFELCPAERQLHHCGRLLPLTSKAFDAILLLVQNAGRLVRKDQLMEALWPDTHVTEANLTNIVVALRKVVGHDAIETVSKHGYRFTLHVLGEPGIAQSAYAQFLRGKALTAERTLESMALARDVFCLCVASDPGFASAWAWLGRCCRFLDKFGAYSPVNRELAQAAIQRALAIDPNLTYAHHFYTQVQADLGQARQAMIRLAKRITERGDEPESYAGMVQVLRYCGLLDESVAAHHRAIALDPCIETSVPHTYFLLGEYEAAIQACGATRGYYLDAASWAARGENARAITLLRERLACDKLSPLFAGLMSSLLAVLEDRAGDALEAMRRANVTGEPEALFYFARHFGMLKNAAGAIEMLRRAHAEGFSASQALERDKAFEVIRSRAEFGEILSDAKRFESNARRDLELARTIASSNGRF